LRFGKRFTDIGQGHLLCPVWKEYRQPPEPPKLEAVAVALSLHSGEWEAIRVALEKPASVLLTDDTAARLAVGNLGIRVHGTIGVLFNSVRQGLKTKTAICLASARKARME